LKRGLEKRNLEGGGAGEGEERNARRDEEMNVAGMMFR